jgi:hypothetical protein
MTMDVLIEEIVSQVRAIDGGTSLPEPMLRQIVGAVVEAMRRERDRERRLEAEHDLRGIGGGSTEVG